MTQTLSEPARHAGMQGEHEGVVLGGAGPDADPVASSGASAERAGAPATPDHARVAGRRASMSHAAQSAARVTGACCGRGEAAGPGAPLALQAGGRAAGVDVASLQSRLEHNGAHPGRTW